MKTFFLALLLVSTSVLAQKVTVDSRVIELSNLKKLYTQVKVMDGMDALVAANGSILAPGFNPVYKSVYSGYNAKTLTIVNPTELESDCLNKLKNKLIKARTKLGIKGADGLSKLGISNVKLVMFSNLDKKIDVEIGESLIAKGGIRGRELIQIAFLQGNECVSQSIDEIVKSLKPRL